ncbi:hypothetical protein [Frigoribacterium sp. CFBP9030]|uniref:hypothetical protein n=1 Tax=Frigoribacterium sp. CFBP9030 TaxID=3096537 RepID=UPI002A6AF5E2|nr:hypothetical protein [Frigoribacterium sp. CFBP9030]MDY0890639.1 hypothetical protein [Frigoribacterium sp. CFBP9030]
MKNTLSAAVALPTAVVIALGGLLIGVPAASAAPAPTEQSVGLARPADGTVVDGTVVDGTAADEAASPAPTVGADPVDGAPVPGEAPVEDVPADQPGSGAPVETPVAVEPTAPGSDVVANPSASPSPAAPPAVEAAAAPGFTVTSPLVGQRLTSAGVRLEASVPTGSTVRWSISDGQSGLSQVADGAFSEAISLDGSTAAVTYTVVLQVSDADGVDLGTIDREFVVAGLPTSSAPTISTPGEGGRVEGRPYESGDYETGAIDVTGTGTPGSVIDIDLLAIVPATPWGYDDEPPVVAADGTWSDEVFVPYGQWSISARQGAFDADGFATTLPSREASVVVSVLRRVDLLPAAPVVTSPAQGGTVVGRPDGSQGHDGSQVFTIAGTGTPGTVIALYGFFPEGRAAIDRYAAAARGEGEGGGEGEFEPLIAGIDPTIVGADGTWSMTESLKPGTYSFAVFTLFDNPDQSFMSGPSNVVTFTLVAPTAVVGTSSTSGTSALAYTGAEGSGPLSVAALVVIGLGLVAVGYARRRTRRLS